MLTYLLATFRGQSPQLWPPQPRQTEQIRNTGDQRFGRSRSLFPSAVSLCRSRTHFPYNLKPSDHSHFALTQSLYIYTAQGEERVNVGNTLLCVKTERTAPSWLIHRFVLFAISDHPCLCCFYRGGVNYVSGVWKDGCSGGVRAAGRRCNMRAGNSVPPWPSINTAKLKNCQTCRENVIFQFHQASSDHSVKNLLSTPRSQNDRKTLKSFLF